MKALTLLIILLASLTVSNSTAQKVQYKKGQVYVDKELKFEFKEIEDESSSLTRYELIDNEGNVVFAMSDTTFFYSRLPNETSQRPALRAYRCTAPEEGLEGVMPYFPIMNYPKQRIKDLQDAGFFKSLAFDEKIIQEFLEKQSPDYLTQQFEEIEKTNDTRQENYKLTEAAFGPLLSRAPKDPGVVINIEKPGSYLIKEGSLLVAKVDLREKGSNNHAYQVVNYKDEIIGEINIFQTPVTQGGLQQYQYNLKPFILGTDNSEGNYKWFYERVKSTGSPGSTTQRLEEVARYMVNEGII